MNQNPQVPQAVVVQPVLEIPAWAKVLLFIVKLLPIPIWIKAIIELIVQIIENIPDPVKKAQAKRELRAAVRKARKNKNPQALVDVVQKYCVGPDCPIQMIPPQ